MVGKRRRGARCTEEARSAMERTRFQFWIELGIDKEKAGTRLRRLEMRKEAGAEERQGRGARCSSVNKGKMGDGRMKRKTMLNCSDGESGG